jgi:hypothetical protein
MRSRSLLNPLLWWGRKRDISHLLTLLIPSGEGMKKSVERRNEVFITTKYVTSN